MSIMSVTLVVASSGSEHGFVVPDLVFEVQYDTAAVHRQITGHDDR